MILSNLLLFFAYFCISVVDGWRLPPTLKVSLKSPLREAVASQKTLARPMKLSHSKNRFLFNHGNSRLFSTAQEIVQSSAPEPPESYKFESNVARVMDIIINSLYSNKDVFLRELISNAADACDKKRFNCLNTGKSLSGLRIRVHSNRDANTLTIEDTGCGMNKQDLIDNLGKIAESGTKRFLENLSNKDKEEVGLIGQFGVGFYSAFLVANKVTVITKGESGEQLKWEAVATSLSTYNISKDTGEQLPETGTKIILHLKEEADQYLDEMNLKTLLERYSEFIAFPIELQRNVSKPEQVPDQSAQPLPDGTIPTKTVMKRVVEWAVVNDKKPLWLRPPRQCTKEDYNDFYKNTFKAYDVPLAHSHFALEGNVDFKAMLYIPSEIPYELSRDMFANSARQMRLYVKRVFINDKFEDLLPRWLIFIKGVVDSDDLPLNVGREILQQSRSLRIIKQRLTKKSIDMFHELASRPNGDYQKFWKNYGKYIKLGIIEEEKMREELVPLVRMYTSYSGSNVTSFPEYINRMKPGQNYIYYASGETREQAAMSPAIEKLKAKGYEVIFISEPLDEMYLQHVEKYGGKQIIDAAKDVPSNSQNPEDKKEKESRNDQLQSLRTWMKLILGDRITKVEASTRLVNSPATLIQSEYGVSPNMQKYYKANAMLDGDDRLSQNKIFSQAVLELNPDHPVIHRLKHLQETAPASKEATDMVELLFSTAALAAGYTLDNSVEYSQQVVQLLTQLANLNAIGKPASASTSSSSQPTDLPAAPPAAPPSAPTSYTPPLSSPPQPASSSSSSTGPEPINAEPITAEPV